MDKALSIRLAELHLDSIQKHLDETAFFLYYYKMYLDGLFALQDLKGIK